MVALGTRALDLTLAGTSVRAQISNCRLVGGAADSGFLSFQDAENGGAREYRLQGIATQDLAEDSVWDLMWSSPGTSVAAILKPNGGVTASATQLWFSGNLIIAEPDGDLLGGESNVSPVAKFTINFDWIFTAKPIMSGRT